MIDRRRGGSLPCAGRPKSRKASQIKRLRKILPISGEEPDVALDVGGVGEATIMCQTGHRSPGGGRRHPLGRVVQQCGRSQVGAIGEVAIGALGAVTDSTIQPGIAIVGP